ncbi:hypothetical protein CYMTET_30577 [Cymbomonas tetramitiformis]|uniref:RCC1-like domain-containing protein n=1 Tax=Cymbomonas tetramitiformis TaxID=36881 RepID=A0AAE0KU22_9CHLO|nr:hypothetical protein CYMTET_30577 [Cymbomonas tetramitiformis]
MCKGGAGKVLKYAATLARDVPSPSARWLATWGNGDFGRLGHSLQDLSSSLPRRVTLPPCNLRQVDCGGAHTAAVSEDGRLFTWGLNDRGQLGHSGDEGHVSVPREVLGIPEDVVSVSAGHYHTLALASSGNLWAFGCNNSGQLGVGSSEGKRTARATLVKAAQDLGVRQVAAGAYHSLAVTEDGQVLGWGHSGNGRLGLGASEWWRIKLSSAEMTPRRVRPLQDHCVRAVAAGHMHSACIDDQGVMRTFGYGRFWALGRESDSDSLTPEPVPGAHGVTEMALGGMHSLSVNLHNEMKAWGANQHGELGLVRFPPVAVTSRQRSVAE